MRGYRITWKAVIGMRWQAMENQVCLVYLVDLVCLVA